MPCFYNSCPPSKYAFDALCYVIGRATTDLGHLDKAHPVFAIRHRWLAPAHKRPPHLTSINRFLGAEHQLTSLVFNYCIQKVAKKRHIWSNISKDSGKRRQYACLHAYGRSSVLPHIAMSVVLLKHRQVFEQHSPHPQQPKNKTRLRC